jgi:hypothetical protein
MRIHSPQITGSAANTNIILTTVTASISVLSSSFAATASYWSGSIINAASASYWSGSIINAATASYVLNAQSASYVVSSSNDAAQNARLSIIESVTGSYATTSSFGTYTASNDLTNTTQSSRLSTIESVTGSFATTSSNVFKASQTISGSLTITQNLTVLGSSSIQYITSSNLNIATNLVTVNTDSPSIRFGGFAVIDSGSSPQRSGSMLFDSVNDQWVFVHQSNTDITSSLLIMGPETYNNLGNEANLTNNRIPKSVNAEHIGDSNISDTGTKVSINSNTEVTGSLTSTGGFTGSLVGTSSYAAQALTASFASTASYISGSVAGFPFSGSAIITGSLFVSGSTISGSFKGDGSQITGLTAGGKIHTQTSAASTWTVTHNLGVQYPNVTVYNSSNEIIIPQTITATDTNTLTLTFGSAVAGYASVGIGGVFNATGRTTQQYFTASATWSFAHNLGDKYVSIQAFDDAFEMVIPTTIRLVDATSSLLLFDSASSGYAVATIGGDLPAISSSYAGYTLQVASSAPYSASWVAVPNVTVTTAQTASYANNFTVGGTLTAQTINVQTITSSIEYVTGSTKNGSLSTNTHQFTGSVLMSGSLGIGTSSPVVPLQVGSGSVSLIPSWMKVMTTDSTQSGIGTVYNNKAIYLYNNGSAIKLDAYDYSASAALNIQIGGNGGNVGIGTTSPSEKFVVYGTSSSRPRLLVGPLTTSTLTYTTYNSQDNPAIEVNTSTTNGFAGLTMSNSDNTSGNTLGCLTFAAAGTSNGEKRGGIIASALESSAASSVSGNLIFYTAAASSIVERMRITSNGDVRIGAQNSTVTTRLAVSYDNAYPGDVQPSHLSLCGVTDSRKRLSLGYDTTNNYGWINSGQWGVTWTDLKLNPSSGAVYAGSVRLDTLSDFRVKDNIQPILGSLDKVLQLNGKKFHLKDEPEDKIRYGFIAQDLEGILDEFVINSEMTFKKDDLVVENVKSIDNWASSWAALLVEAIKELSAKNTTLEERLTALENK